MAASHSAAQGTAGPSQPLPPGSVDRLCWFSQKLQPRSLPVKILSTHRHVPVSVICINVVTKEISLFFRCANFSLALPAWILPQGPVCLHPPRLPASPVSMVSPVSACVPAVSTVSPMSACIPAEYSKPASPQCLPASPQCLLCPRCLPASPHICLSRPCGVCLRP